MSWKRKFILLAIASFSTAVTWFIEFSDSDIGINSSDTSSIYRGLPWPFWSQTHATYDFGTGQFPIFSPSFSWIVVVIDVFLWFLLLKPRIRTNWGG